ILKNKKSYDIQGDPMIENKERKFLHDISSPVGTAIFVLDIVLDTLKSHTNPPEELIQIQQLSGIFERIKTLIEERRREITQETLEK
ncbi:MAG: hypothetical protein ABIQ95_14060, partial [Bdellovibrionia bacterium]